LHLLLMLPISYFKVAILAAATQVENKHNKDGAYDYLRRKLLFFWDIQRVADPVKQ